MILVATKTIPASIQTPEMHSLWYTTGDNFCQHGTGWQMENLHTDQASSLIISSEPLTKNKATWLELQKYSMLAVEKIDNKIHFRKRELNL
jgi:glutamine amidotransferase